MVNSKSFQKIIDEDLLAIKFLLKNKVASFDEVKKEEEKIIDSVKQLMSQIKEMELILEKEIGMYKRLAKGWEKAYVDRRWKAIGKAIQYELDSFHGEYSKTKDIHQECFSLHDRLQELVSLLKKMSARNKESREEELKLLEDFKTQKRKLMEKS